MENKKIKILAIDDNNDNLISLKALIKEAFPDSIRLTAQNGAAGINLAQVENPDVVLLDVLMPGMDGFEVCQKLKANPETSNIPVIFVTAIKGERENRIRALEVGAEAFLAKPIDETEMTAQVRAMLKIKAANDQKQNEKDRLDQMVKDKTRELEKNYTATLNLLGDLQDEIEARKRTEAALRESERQLIRSEASLIKAQHVAHVGSWSWYIQDDRLEWSEEMYRIFGYEKEKFSGSLSDVMANAIHPDDRAAVAESNRSVLKDKKPIPIEYRVLWPDRSVHTVWGEAGELILDDEGKPILLTGIVQDITERKQAEAEIQLQATALKAAANGILITNRDGEIQWANPAFTTLSGYTLSEVYGKNPRELVKSGQHNQAFYQQMWETLLAGEVWRGELVNRRKDGTLLTEEQTITPLLDVNGQITHFIGIKQDITARKQSEAEVLQYAIRQEKIAALGRALAAELDLDVIYRTAEDQIRLMIDCPNFAITLFDPQLQILKSVYASSDGKLIDFNSTPPLRVDLRHASCGRSKALASKSPEIVLDIESNRKSCGGLRLGNELEPKSAIYIPILAEGQVIGLLELQSYQYEAYTAKDGEWLSVAANLIGMSIQNARLFFRTQQRVDELSALAIIDSAITSRLAPQEMYEILLEQVTSHLGVDAATLILFDHTNHKLECVLKRGYTQSEDRQPYLSLDESLAGKAAQEKRMVHVDHLSSENAHMLIHESLIEGFEEYYGVPLLVEDVVIGVLEVLHRSRLNPDSDWLHFLELISGQSAIVISTLLLNKDLNTANIELLKAYDATIEGWSQAMDLRDRETEGHTQRVTKMTLELAKEMGIAGEQLAHLRRGALLHDIGKLGVPDSILLKSASLADEEWVLMKKHPEYAHHMLEAIEYLRPALEIPFCHHEKWDGSGYPRGLKGNEIPLPARVFAIIDVWDALTSDRPYRKAWTKRAAFEHICEQSEKHFDPQVVKVFSAYIKKELDKKDS